MTDLDRVRLTGVTHATYRKKKQIRGNSEPRDLIVCLLLVVVMLRRALHQHRAVHSSRQVRQVVRATTIGRAMLKGGQGETNPAEEEARVAQLRWQVAQVQ